MTNRFVEVDCTVASLERPLSLLNCANTTTPGTRLDIAQMLSMPELQCLVDCTSGQLSDLMADFFDF